MDAVWRVRLQFALIGLPVVIGYTVFIHRVFKGKPPPAEREQTRG
jgi:cytochrome bd-type quinol oxidase subunit 2